jgi:hypothetical protein
MLRVRYDKYDVEPQASSLQCPFSFFGTEVSDIEVSQISVIHQLHVRLYCSICHNGCAVLV